MSDHQPIELNLSSSALAHGNCELALDRVINEGYKEKTMKSNMVYGIGVHKFISEMYLTNGHIPTARQAAIDAFNAIPRTDDRKSPHLSDVNHMHAVALWTWEMCVKADKDFEILMLNDKPAVEVNFSIPFYRDEYVIINWCGTLDRIGKIKNGIWIIPDWKTTSSWSEKEYFTSYELARAPRGYVLAMKLMAELYPDSILGQIGKGAIGVRFDGVFVKPAVNDVKFARSDVYRVDDEKQVNEFRELLTDKCREISNVIKTGYRPKNGIVNGGCEGKWGKCMFWNVCKVPDVVGEVLLKRDFDRKPFNPCAYND